MIGGIEDMQKEESSWQLLVIWEEASQLKTQDVGRGGFNGYLRIDKTVKEDEIVN